MKKSKFGRIDSWIDAEKFLFFCVLWQKLQFHFDFFLSRKKSWSLPLVKQMRWLGTSVKCANKSLKSLFLIIRLRQNWLVGGLALVCFPHQTIIQIIPYSLSFLSQIFKILISLDLKILKIILKCLLKQTSFKVDVTCYKNNKMPFIWVF
jgi:hypothetical protein